MEDDASEEGGKIGGGVAEDCGEVMIVEVK
jgi:hypothetical protein